MPNMSAGWRGTSRSCCIARSWAALRRFIGIPDRELCRQDAAVAGAAAGRGGSIVSGADDYVHEVVAALRAAGLRAEADTQTKKINYKVREHSVGKVLVIMAVGMKEVEDRSVSIRRLDRQGSESQTLDEAIGSPARRGPPRLRRA